MTKKIKPQTLKGFRDFLPKDMVIRQKVIETLKIVFESYGFEPLETPALEYADTLLGKSGKEAEKLMYLFKDSGGRDVGLRYELTISLARVMAQYPNIPLPFKRYQMQPVWRAEKPQKGRYREFLQCDVDIMGTTSFLADAEIIEIIYQSIIALGFKKFVIKINNRKLLFKLMEDANVPKEKRLATLISIDKLGKNGRDKVETELILKGLPKENINKIFNLISKIKPDETLEEIFRTFESSKIPKEYFQFDPTLVRGLDYYTGPIYEAIVEKPKIGSIAGGGRYDKLISNLGGPDIPATGVSFGLDRICDVIKEQNLWPNLSPTPTKVLISVFSPEYLENSIEIANKLRAESIPTELYLDPETKLDKQLKYASKKGIPYVIIAGPEEIKAGKSTIKAMKTGKQETVFLARAIEIIKKNVS